MAANTSNSGEQNTAQVDTTPDNTGEVSVVLAHHMTREGRNIKPGSKVSLPADQARSLIASGRAHPAA